MQKKVVKPLKKLSSSSKKQISCGIPSNFSKNYNALFYQNKVTALPTTYKLQDMHQWKGNYEILEKNHSYIQWIFPTRQKSKFNISSRTLTNEEYDIFRQDMQIQQNMIKSYEMMLDFYGMNMVDYNTGQLQRNKNYKERYTVTFVKAFHNHLRISRILESLNACGFRIYAINLVKFLQKEMEDENSPLSVLAQIKRNPMIFWQKYGEIDQQNKYQVEFFEKTLKLEVGYCDKQAVILQQYQQQQQGDKQDKISNNEQKND